MTCWNRLPDMTGPTCKSHSSLWEIRRTDSECSGLCWNMFAVSKDNIFFIVSWDTAQMNVDEVERHCEGMADVMRRLAKVANWERSIADVFSGRAHIP